MTRFDDHLNRGLERKEVCPYHTFGKTVVLNKVSQCNWELICADIWHLFRATPLVKDPGTLAMIHRFQSFMHSRALTASSGMLKQHS